MKKIRKVTIVKTTEIILNQQKLVDILRKHFEQSYDVKIELNHQVPGGGDWSHMELDFDTSPLTITITEKEETEQEVLPNE